MSAVPFTTPVTLVNLTPHAVTLLLEAGTRIELPPSDTVPRLLLAEGREEQLEVRVAPEGSKNTDLATVTVPVTVGSVLAGVEPALPEPRPGTVYVTSRVVAEYHPHRRDLVWPEGLVRDEAGEVAGARRLASLHSPVV